MLEEVGRGETVVITKHGLPVAMLVPVDTSPRLDPAEAVRRLREFRHGRLLGSGTLRDLIDDGRSP
ncbi:MAG: type II toxin-antitoxin system prevent-host-death family antitoxin [Actinobacteria bacterium]|nr:type II toxin-antitoxin system prevent-host-death family antitoxin [Actinomycetota bacterium]